MTFHEKNALAFGIIAIIGYAVYAVIVLPQLAATPPGEIDYVVPMLATIGAGILAGIIASIVLDIASPKGARREDERDVRISRFGDRVGGGFIAIAAIVAIVLSMLRVDWFWIANTLYLAFVLSAVTSTMAKIAAYHGEVDEW